MRKLKLRTRSIFYKMLSGYAVLTLLIVALTGVISYFLVRNYTTHAMMSDLGTKAATFSQMLSQKGANSRILRGDRLNEFQRLTEAQFVYVVRSGDNYRGSFVPHRAMLREISPGANIQEINILDKLDIELIERILGGEFLTTVRSIKFAEAETEMILAGAPVVDDEEVTGAVILMRPLGDVSNSVGSIVIMEGWGGLVALLMATVLAYGISRALTKPLERLNIAAHRVADGHYGESVDIPEGDEIGQLGLTLNLLSVRLKDAFGTLQNEKIKLEQILAGIGEGIVAIDQFGNIIHHNPAALRLLEMRRWRIDDEGHAAQLMDLLFDAVQQNGATSMHWINAGGLAVEATIAPYCSGEGIVLGAVALIRDVSESQRLEQMRRDYIANISHELRTPLTGIRGMTEPLIDGLMETETEKQDCYRVIYQETLRLERLIGEMLDLSRLQEGRVEPELEPMEPEGLIEAAVRRVSARAEAQEIDLSMELPDENLCILGSESRIIQVLTIFLDNALSFTPPGGTVCAFVRKENNRAVFGVSDNGAGIDPKDLPYVFERFYKADKSRMGTSGTGLGLAIAKLVVELIHGEIHAESELGKGSTFTFSLELWESESSTAK